MRSSPVKVPGPNYGVTMTDSRMLWDLDVRVRDRNLKTGRLKKDEVQKYYEGLADVSARADTVELRQPALAGGDEKVEVAPPVQLAPPVAYSPAPPGIPAMPPVAPAVVPRGDGTDTDDDL
jgi:hypothetical protein